MTDPKSTRKPILSAADDMALFPDGWLTDHLDKLMDDLALQPESMWPKLTGPNAEAQDEINASLRRRRDAIEGQEWDLPTLDRVRQGLEERIEDGPSLGRALRFISRMRAEHYAAIKSATIKGDA